MCSPWLKATAPDTVRPLTSQKANEPAARATHVRVFVADTALPATRTNAVRAAAQPMAEEPALKATFTGGRRAGDSPVRARSSAAPAPPGPRHGPQHAAWASPAARAASPHPGARGR